MLLDYVVFAVLIFYVLTIAGLFVLRKTRPDAERPYRAFGYPFCRPLYRRCDRDFVGAGRLPHPNFMAGITDRARGCAGVFSLEKSADGMTC